MCTYLADGITVSDLCDKAHIRYCVTGGRQPLVLLDNKIDGHIKTQINGESVYIVSSKSICTDEPERSLRILEVLAYAFHDYTARESVCFKNLFRVE